MRVDIFIVSYAKDKEWLLYNLQSIRKFASGFGETIILVPVQEEKDFANIVFPKTRFLYYDRVDNPSLWHLQHQCEKMHADVWCSEADLILHTDSDCIFTAPVSPQDYIFDGQKPVLLIEEYARLKGDHWKPTVDRALGINAQYETMRRHPAVHWRDLYHDCRTRVAEATGMGFEGYVLSVKPDFPWGISEFNVLGSFAHWSDKWRDRYHFIDVGKEPHPASSKKLMQFWSHSPPNQPQGTPNTGEHCIPLDVIKRILK